MLLHSVVHAASLLPPTRQVCGHAVIPIDPIIRAWRSRRRETPAVRRRRAASDWCRTRSRRSRKQARRSEEHTSELQSLMRISYAVFCLKKKNKINTNIHIDRRKYNAKQSDYITSMKEVTQ